MDRRSFVGAGVLTAAACSLRLNAKEAAEGAIDAHVHVWGKADAKYPMATGFGESDRAPESFTSEQLMAQCQANGVSRVVLIQMNFFGFDNSYMLDCIRNHPGVYSGVAVIDENQRNAVATMKQMAKDGVRGFRLYADKKNAEAWLASSAMQQMWAAGADAGLAMCLLSNPDALKSIHALCQKFPKTPVVVDHFSRIGMKGEVQASELDALIQLAQFPNVYVKTSAFYALGSKRAPYTDLGEMIQKLRDSFGANRLMWGSDCPYQVQEGHTYASSIALIREKLPFLSSDDRDWILRKTAQKVFFS